LALEVHTALQGRRPIARLVDALPGAEGAKDDARLGLQLLPGHVLDELGFLALDMARENAHRHTVLEHHVGPTRLSGLAIDSDGWRRGPGLRRRCGLAWRHSGLGLYGRLGCSIGGWGDLLGGFAGLEAEREGHRQRGR